MQPDPPSVIDPRAAQQDETEPIDVREYLRPVWRYKWLIIILVAVVTAAVYAKQARQPERFEASTRLYVGIQTASQLLGGTGTQSNPRTVANQAALVTTRATAQRVARTTGFRGRPESLLRRVSATPESVTDFLEVTASGSTGAEAADLADAFAAAFIQTTGENNRNQAVEARRLAQRQLDALPRGVTFATQRQDLQAQIGQLSAAINTPSGNAEVVDPATAPTEAVAPRPGRDAIFAFVLALAVGIGLAYVLARADRRIRRVDDVPGSYRLPLLAAVPHTAETASYEQGQNATLGALKETFRGLRSNLLLAALGTDVHVIVVVSAMPAEGKSTTTRNLALAYHEAGSSVCVVDADLRRPSQRRLLHQTQAQQGLTDVLVGETTLEDALIEVPVADVSLPARATAPGLTATTATPARFTLLHSGLEPANPQAVLASQPTKELIERLKQLFDIVIIDTPPLLVVSDAIPLVVDADAVVVVGRVNQTTRDAATRVSDLLTRTRANVLGVVGNDVSGFGAKAGVYAYYGYGPAPEARRGSKRSSSSSKGGDKTGATQHDASQS